MDDRIKKMLDRFNKDNYVIIRDGELTKLIVKKPNIKKLRKNGELIIGRDRRRKETIFFKKPKI